MEESKNTELARRAVACPGWRWMPGMYDGDVRVLNRSDEMAPLIVISSEDGGVDWVSVKAMDLPDITDPATLGCLLTLVREAWGAPHAHVEPTGGGEYRTWVGTCDDAGPWDWVALCSSEAEALVCALEAAPR